MDEQQRPAKRAAFIDAIRWGILPAAPQLRFARVAGWWIERCGEEGRTVVNVPRVDGERKSRLSAKERAALRWAT